MVYFVIYVFIIGVAWYLCRLEPFASLLLQMQGGKCGDDDGDDDGDDLMMMMMMMMFYQ